MRKLTYYIEAQDFADDDGGTLYTLFDECDVPLASGPWPMPLEAFAATRGFPVKRRRPILGEHDQRFIHIQHERIVEQILSIPPRPIE